MGDATLACYTEQVAVLLALVSGVVYGVSDYVGGRTSRRVHPVSVAFLAECALAVIMGIGVPLIEDASPTPAAVWWGLAAGVFGGLGAVGLYIALSAGNMTVVAPVTGLVAAAVPVIVGVSLGERPAPIAAGGIVLAVFAVALIGGMVGVGHAAAPFRLVVLAIGVGIAFGMLFVAFSRTGDDSGLWPLLTARITAWPMLAVAAVVMLPRGQRLVRDRRTLAAGLSIGVLIGLANGLYLLATHRGLLSVVSVLVALYPASTVLLAAVLDGERPSRWQLVGMGVAVLGVALITTGA